MNWCKAPLILPGTTSELKRLTAVEKSAAAACGTNAYLQFKLAQLTLS